MFMLHVNVISFHLTTKAFVLNMYFKLKMEKKEIKSIWPWYAQMISIFSVKWGIKIILQSQRTYQDYLWLRFLQFFAIKRRNIFRNIFIVILLLYNTIQYTIIQLHYDSLQSFSVITQWLQRKKGKSIWDFRGREWEIASCGRRHGHEHDWRFGEMFTI